MIKKLVPLVVLCACSLFAQPSQSAPPGIWKPLQFLIGTWEAKTQAGSAQASSSGTYSFAFELGNHVIARHADNKNSTCKGPADLDCDHGDLLYIYPEGPVRALKAIYFDNEGHVIHYDVFVPGPTSAVFVSDPSLPGQQYRLSYEMKGATMQGKFEIRPPGQSDFKTYLEWSGEKKQTSEPSPKH
jgi:hypothetical protein